MSGLSRSNCVISNYSSKSGMLFKQAKILHFVYNTASRPIIEKQNFINVCHQKLTSTYNMAVCTMTELVQSQLVRSLEIFKR